VSANLTTPTPETEQLSSAEASARRESIIARLIKEHPRLFRRFVIAVAVEQYGKRPVNSAEFNQVNLVTRGERIDELRVARALEERAERARKAGDDAGRERFKQLARGVRERHRRSIEQE
jgi:hypothetical protein